jgi:hypothetical protein
VWSWCATSRLAEECPAEQANGHSKAYADEGVIERLGVVRAVRVESHACSIAASVAESHGRNGVRQRAGSRVWSTARSPGVVCIAPREDPAALGLPLIGEVPDDRSAKISTTVRWVGDNGDVVEAVLEAGNVKG